MQTWDYRGYLIEPILALLEHIFYPKIWDFFKKWFFSMFDKSAGSADINKKVRESCVWPILTRIHNIWHIHKTNFAQTQFSRSYPQKTRFLKKRHFTFFWKYLVCAFKIEISEYPTKLVIITYTPYKYEVNRTKTHEIRAKSLWAFFFSSLYMKKSLQNMRHF